LIHFQVLKLPVFLERDYWPVLHGTIFRSISYPFGSVEQRVLYYEKNFILCNTGQCSCRTASHTAATIQLRVILYDLY